MNAHVLYLLKLKKSKKNRLSVCLYVRKYVRPSVCPARMQNNFWRS